MLLVSVILAIKGNEGIPILTVQTLLANKENAGSYLILKKPKTKEGDGHELRLESAVGQRDKDDIFVKLTI